MLTFNDFPSEFKVIDSQNKKSVDGVATFGYNGNKTIERESFSHFAIMIKSNMLYIGIIYVSSIDHLYPASVLALSLSLSLTYIMLMLMCDNVSCRCGANHRGAKGDSTSKILTVHSQFAKILCIILII